MNCNFIQRWWHRRLRNIDLTSMYPIIMTAAKTPEIGQAAWNIFKQQEGQEHWNCECSRKIKK